MKGSILVVDDDEQLKLNLMSALMKMGYIVYSSQNGKECIEFIQKTKPNVILMDCFMPTMDGFTAIKIIQSKNYKIPIIMMSSDQIDSNGLLFLRKPFKLENLLQMIENVSDIQIH